MDKISALVGKHGFRARILHNGSLAGTVELPADARHGYLHLVREGELAFTHEAVPRLRITTPALVFYPRGLRHALHAPPGTPASLLSAATGFQGGADNPLVRALPPFMVVPLTEGALGPTLRVLALEAEREEEGRDLVLERLTDVLIIQIMRHAFKTGRLSPQLLAGLADERLGRALAAIHDAPQSDWKLTSLARVAGMSRSAFALYFQQVVGITPGDYLLQSRMNLAMTLLRQGEQVKAVSAGVGYASQPAFTRAFTESTGLSPRAWLQEQAA